MVLIGAAPGGYIEIIEPAVSRYISFQKAVVGHPKYNYCVPLLIVKGNNNIWSLVKIL